MRTKLIQGDNILSLKKLPDNSVDSVVTDPPYGLSFMNKKWDHQVPSVEFWKEVYRVLKPGGHVLSFGGTRTYHRMTVNIEDAGFEIRDQIMWLYGSGFPKSMNIGKSVDKIRGNEREVVGDNPNHRTTAGLLELGFQDGKESSSITKGTSEWEGWGTALKPSNEPICVARKPMSEKTIVANVLKWGTGGINIDGCRVAHNEPIRTMKAQEGGNKVYQQAGRREETTELKEEGRFPANIILDEEAGKILDEQSDKASRFFYCPKVSKKERNAGCDDLEEKQQDLTRKEGLPGGDNPRNRGVNKTKNNHPTVKPIELMAYLCKLITPPNGIVLDPFMGSGSTGIAAVREGFRFCGMELDNEYFEIATKRIEHFERTGD